MTEEFISTIDAAQSASYANQKAIRDEIADMSFKLRRDMDAGLSPDEMKAAQGAKEAADAAAELLGEIF